MTKANASDAAGVQLPDGATGSSFLCEVLHGAALEFPDALGAAEVPPRERFKSGFDEALARFEAVRVASSQRSAVARFIVAKTQSAIRFVQPSGSERPLTEWLRQEAAPLSWSILGGGALPAELSVPRGGRVFSAGDWDELGRDLSARHGATRSVEQALGWMAQRVAANGGRLDLRGQRFAILGAGAELAPTSLLLDAGAEVLWLDVKPPPAPLTDRPTAGRLFVVEGADLLLRPAEVKATIEQFARDQPVHLGAYAYAPGSSREWRLTAAMNAIIAALDPGRVASVSLLISPTTAAPMEPEDVAAAKQRREQRPSWQSALARAGVLREGPLHHGDVSVARSVVTLQGAAYQAAQYIGKVLTAEAFAAYGPTLDHSEKRPLRVSANVAGITKTRSLSHPLFDAAFNGASRFGIEIFEPSTTRALNGILAVHDLLNDESPAARAARDPDEVPRLFREQVHGGVRGLPYALGSAIRVAALIGVGKNPMVLARRKGRGAAVVTT